VSADALFFGAHPDDIELTSGGLAALLAAHGHQVVLVDLTRGERASRGTPEARATESAAAARELGVAGRECLGLPDLGLERSDRGQLEAVVRCVRTHQPALVVAPHVEDAHPDHVEASHLIRRACYVAGLAGYVAGAGRHRPGQLLFALYRGAARPHVVVDVTPVWDRRTAALRAHQSQLAGPAGPETYLTDPGFEAEVEGRARGFGSLIGVRFGEGYRTPGPLAVHDARSLLHGAGAGR
jgi:N-acetylglucosamine malate deacetylase 1